MINTKKIIAALICNVSLCNEHSGQKTIPACPQQSCPANPGGACKGNNCCIVRVACICVMTGSLLFIAYATAMNLYNCCKS